MSDLVSIATNLAWPLVIVLAWIVGEFGHRWTGVPRIAFYGLVGFALAQSQAGVLPASYSMPVLVLADVGFGLILFELGYRINLRWLSTNPWIGVAGVVESFATFLAVYYLAMLVQASTITAFIVASLSMATSPATVLRVINEMRSSGQVTERVLHLSALNCMLSVFTFNVILGFWIFRSSGDIGDATLNSLVMLLMSVAVGALFGVLVPALLHRLGNVSQDATVAFALAVILLVAITYSTKLSPVVAALAFGLMARHRRVAFSQAERSFGALGELLTVLLFVFAASTLAWTRLVDGIWLASAVLVARLLTKTVGVTIFAPLSGLSWRKGVLTGVALAPVSVFAVLLLEHARLRGVSLPEELRVVAAMTMLLEFVGPLIVQRALMLARETPTPPER